MRYEVHTYGVFNYNNYIIENRASCALEYVYLSNNESIFNGILIKDSRYNFGKQLWIEEDGQFKKNVANNKKDFIVSYVPKTAYYAARGYAKESELSFMDILSVNRPGRTFIISNQNERIRALYEKFKVNTDKLSKFCKKKLILVDDSIVRGNTLGVIVQKLMATNCFSEIHLRSASPPVYFEDFMGIDIPTKQELIANRLSPPADIITSYTEDTPPAIYHKDHNHLYKKMCEFLKVTSVKYLSINGIYEVLQFLDLDKTNNNWCVSWSNGNYPIQFENEWKLYEKINIKNGNGFSNGERLGFQ